MSERQRSQHDGVDDGEDCGVRADAERQGDQRDRGEAGILTEHAEGVKEILSRRRQQVSSSCRVRDWWLRSRRRHRPPQIRGEGRIADLVQSFLIGRLLAMALGEQRPIPLLDVLRHLLDDLRPRNEARVAEPRGDLLFPITHDPPRRCG